MLVGCFCHDLLQCIRQRAVLNEHHFIGHQFLTEDALKALLQVLWQLLGIDGYEDREHVFYFYFIFTHFWGTGEHTLSRFIQTAGATTVLLLR